ncbi:PEBP-like protein [Diplogelasinospora grovesii]|uniref:PEBP-like protein n=1 Tax=Diplogelasinospora grovesii TaxID=303347 RepID=A0AAN6NGD0_9PEZI|nr:PEBP-like protein [Diplogelasinospora grovesii]
MVSQSIKVVLAAASLCFAKTPNGFQPASTTDLIVEYGNIAALNGAVVAKATTANQPTIGTTQKLTGSSYAVVMIDLDIPTNSPPATTTLLHWMQTGLTPATTATKLNTTMGNMNVFLLENKQNTSAFAAYISPAPPARIPLSHRYTQILVDTSDITTQETAMLQTVAKNRTAFQAETVLSMVNLQNKVVAGNSFNVTNPGPAQNAATGTGAGSSNTTTGSGSGRGSASGTGTRQPTASATFVGVNGGNPMAKIPMGGSMVVVLGAVACAVFLGL